MIKRFDRKVTSAGILRHRMVSAATVFQADEAAATLAYTGSYMRLSRELARWTITGDRDRSELFRRIAFNCLCSVTDDHERNHALVADGSHYQLAPAFDLVPQPANTRRRFLALNAGDFGGIASRANLLSSAESFLLSVPEANRIIDEMAATIRLNWQKCCRDRGVSDEDAARIAACFNPASFDEEPATPTLL